MAAFKLAVSLREADSLGRSCAETDFAVPLLAAAADAFAIELFFAVEDIRFAPSWSLHSTSARGSVQVNSFWISSEI